MYSFVKSEWLKLGGGGGIEGLLVDKCGFARKHFMLGKYRGLQSVLDSWPDPQNCSHFLLPPGLTGFLSTPIFPQILRLKIYFPRYNRSIQFNFYLEQRSVSGSLVLFFSFLVSCPLCTVTFFYILARLQHVLFICGIPQRVCDG